MQCLILPFSSKTGQPFADTISPEASLHGPRISTSPRPALSPSPTPSPECEWNPSGRDALDIYTTKAPNGDELIIVSLKKLEIQ